MKKGNITSIKRIRIIPHKTLHETFKRINNTELTFGVHKEDSNNHSLRDSLQNKTLHKSLYGNPSNINNASLLAKTEQGFITDMNIGGKIKQIEVAPRPILKPMLTQSLKKSSGKALIKNGLKYELSFNSPYATKDAFIHIAQNLSTENILNFLRNRGEKYWNKNAKHNSPYTAMVKFIETLGQSGIENFYNEKTQTINAIGKWENAKLYKKGDMPLQDSLDLVKSIKAKVNAK